MTINLGSYHRNTPHHIMCRVVVSLILFGSHFAGGHVTKSLLLSQRSAPPDPLQCTAVIQAPQPTWTSDSDVHHTSVASPCNNPGTIEGRSNPPSIFQKECSRCLPIQQFFQTTYGPTSLASSCVPSHSAGKWHKLLSKRFPMSTGKAAAAIMPKA